MCQYSVISVVSSDVPGLDLNEGAVQQRDAADKVRNGTDGAALAADLGVRWTMRSSPEVASMTIATLAVSLLCVRSDSAPGSKMKVTYHRDAKRAYKPKEPAWSGDPPCAQFPTSGAGTLRLTGAVTQPTLKHKEKGDYSRLTAKTRPFAPFLAEYTISAEGLVTEVRVLRSVSEEFDALVLRELETSVYAPAMLNGEPVAVCATLLARPHP